MMKLLIIPDVHLKAWMFNDADKLLNETDVDRAIFLGDLVDEWECQYNEALYRETIDAALEFEQHHPETFWCFGNHDMGYIWQVIVPGRAEDPGALEKAVHGMNELYYSIPSENLGFVHRIDDVLFSHAGVSYMFMRRHFDDTADDDDFDVVSAVNNLHMHDLWQNNSPLWVRPQEDYCGFPMRMYRQDKYLQVVGHSPMKEITRQKNLLSCDVFSLYRDGTPIGTQEFCLLDTGTWEWKGVKRR